MPTKAQTESARRTGLANKRHGYSKSGKKRRAQPIYCTWQSMRMRCQNPKDRSFADYGGRGITVCERWEKFENFLADMGDKPLGKSLDRINNNKGYSPKNCRWATRKQQAHNTRSARLITYKGETLPLLQWQKKTGIKRDTIKARLKKGFSVAQVLGFEPIKHWRHREPMRVTK